jgi:Protein of unknown function (DUF992)
MLLRSTLATLAALTLAGNTEPVPGFGAITELGDLTCSVARSAKTAAAASSQSLPVRCLFREPGTGIQETYTGTVLSASEADLGSHALTWVVRGPQQDKDRAGLLAQTYALAQTGIEKAAPALIAEGNSPVSLQPLLPDDTSSQALVPVLAIELKLKASIG